MKSVSLRSRLADEALVLEIGSGGRPWPRSDVLVDRYYFDDVGQRGGAEIFRDRRPLVVAAGERLPFVNKAFDFVYCNHVVEHADDIGSFLDELSRVGQSGYLECPSPALERILNQPQHRWYIAQANGTLLIHPKPKDSAVAMHDDRLYFRMMSDHLLIRSYWDLFTVQLEWMDHIPYEMRESLEAVFSQATSEEQVAKRIEGEKMKVLIRILLAMPKEQLKHTRLGQMGMRMLARQRRMWRQLSGRVRISMEQLEALLCCPYCKATLVKSPSFYHCTQCQREYHVENGVPIFL